MGDLFLERLDLFEQTVLLLAQLGLLLVYVNNALEQYEHLTLVGQRAKHTSRGHCLRRVKTVQERDRITVGHDLDEILECVQRLLYTLFESLHVQVHFGLGRELIVGSQRSYLADGLLAELHLRFEFLVTKRIEVLLQRVRSHADTRRVGNLTSRQSLVQFLAYERHERTDQSQTRVQTRVQDLARIVELLLLFLRLVLGVEARL